MIKYAFVVDAPTGIGQSMIIFQEPETDPPERWHYLQTVDTNNALLFVDALNKVQ